ncbi:hypothetical protein ACHAXS_008800 [Conticribra weissflogii]
MSRAFVFTSNKISLLFGATLIAGYLLGRLTSTAGKRSKNQTQVSGNENNSGAFVLLVNLKFSELSHRDTFLQLIKPVCQDVIESEGPNGSGTTLSYQVAISDKNPLMVVVMERYSDKDNGYLTVHKSGKEFLKFRKELQGLQERGDVEISGESFIETELGFV